MSILIVDDSPHIHAQLSQLLTMAGFLDLLFAPGAREAFGYLGMDKEKRAIPGIELILLDVIMPEINGIEACRRIKSFESLRDIPIIMVTADTSTDSLEAAFDAGAVDYIVKPLKKVELLARIRSILALKNEMNKRHEAEGQLLKINAELERRVDERTSELIKTSKSLKDSMETIREAQEKLMLAEKMAALGKLVAGATHEINTPLGLGITSASFLKQKTQDLSARITGGKISNSDFENFLKTADESLAILLSNLNRCAELVKSFKTVAVDQCSGEKRKFNLKAYLDEIVLSLRPSLKRTRHKIILACPEHLEIESYPGAFSRILTNLVINSLVHGFGEKDAGEISIIAEIKDNCLVLKYGDNGRGIDNKYLDKIFDPYFTTKSGKGGSGLGMHIVYNLVTRQLGGDIQCFSTPGKGVLFQINIPIYNRFGA